MAKKVRKSTNPVGRPRKTTGTETLLNNKNSFRLKKNVVFDSIIDALILSVIILLEACLITYIFVR